MRNVKNVRKPGQVIDFARKYARICANIECRIWSKNLSWQIKFSKLELSWKVTLAPQFTIVKNGDGPRLISLFSMNTWKKKLWTVSLLRASPDFPPLRPRCTLFAKYARLPCASALKLSGRWIRCRGTTNSYRGAISNRNFSPLLARVGERPQNQH